MGFIAPILADVGSAVGSAAGAVGSTLADVGSTLGGLFTGEGGAGAADAAGAAGGAGAAGAGGAGAAGTAGGLAGGGGFLPALSNIGHAITGAGAPSEAGYLASLGQSVPAGVELVGPSSTFAGPGFLQGLMQGFTGTAQQLASPSAGTSAGTGLGQLFDALSKLPQAQMPPMPGITGAPRPLVGVSDIMRGATKILSPGPPGTPAPGPIMSALHTLLAGF